MENQYYIVDLAATKEHKKLRLQRWDDAATEVLSEAARVPESVVITDLNLYDNGQDRLAILCEAIDQLAPDGTTRCVPHYELLWLCKQEHDEHLETETKPRELCA